MTKTNPSVGTISDATREDLEALAFDFAWTLRMLSTGDRDRERRRAALATLAQYDGRAEDDENALSDFVDTAGREALESYCPPYMRFDENHDGQFGFWPDISCLEDDVRSRSGVVKVNAGDPWPPLRTADGDAIDYVMEVNDHGNVTLYSRSRREIWSCV